MSDLLDLQKLDFSYSDDDMPSCSSCGASSCNCTLTQINN